MTRARVALAVALAACGKSPGGPAPTIDAPPPDAAPPIDAATQLEGCTVTHGTTMSMRKLGNVGGLGAILATSPPDDHRLFVLERGGKIRIFEHEQLRDAPFLDLGYPTGPVAAGGSEFGLLGLAFHPQYAQNGYFYVYYTATNPGDAANPYAEIVARYQVSATDPDTADPKSGTVLLKIPDFASVHNGGMIEFGPDGDLYIGEGDGGGPTDPKRASQDPTQLLGKILRIDVDHPANGKPYGIPADNPWASGAGGAPEVYVLGLRNPWRWSFDRGTGDLWIGDVGAQAYEEIDYLPAGKQAAANLGWSVYEGQLCVTNYPCVKTGLQFPSDQREAAKGWHAIIAGQVYRGPCYPDLTGWFFYTDWSLGALARARPDATGALTVVDVPGTFPAHPSSLHADWRGELYVTTTDGDVYHLEAALP